MALPADDDFRIPTALRRQPPATVGAEPRAPLLAVAKGESWSPFCFRHGFWNMGMGEPATLGLSRKHGQRTSGVFQLGSEDGINLFDTADSYGTGRLNGQSERLLGKIIREFEGLIKSPDDVVIATKFAACPWRLTSGCS